MNNMNIYFTKEDLKRLSAINDESLYVLNCRILDALNETKRSILVCMFDEKLIYALVELAETAAKEAACRNGWSPVASKGKYCTTGITYDTKEYRKWLKHHTDVKTDIEEVSKFSFWDNIVLL